MSKSSSSDSLQLAPSPEDNTESTTDQTEKSVTSPTKSKKTARFSVKAAAETESRKNSDFSENSSIPELPSNDQTAGLYFMFSHF